MRVLVEIHSRSGRKMLRATTLGAGGLFVETATPLPAGSRVSARFQLPGRSAVHHIRARVAWTRPLHPERRYSPGMGIAFTDRTAAARLARELEDGD